MAYTIKERKLAILWEASNSLAKSSRPPITYYTTKFSWLASLINRMQKSQASLSPYWSQGDNKTLKAMCWPRMSCFTNQPLHKNTLPEPAVKTPIELPQRSSCKSNDWKNMYWYGRCDSRWGSGKNALHRILVEKNLQNLIYFLNIRNQYKCLVIDITVFVVTVKNVIKLD